MQRKRQVKSYPSIRNARGKSFRQFRAHVFDKLDGNNIRCEWNRKGGWCKFGTRRRLLDESDPFFGQAISIFWETLAEPLEKIAREHRWEKITAFSEYWGENSLAGMHQEGDIMRLSLFDVFVYKKHFVEPLTFLNLFEHLDIPRYLGEVNWTPAFVERVLHGDVEGITFEGVVGKAGKGHKRITAKVKTNAWIAAIRELFGESEAEEIINS
jgi:hypothetical protein